MTLLQDGLIAFLSAVGVTTLVWIVAGAFSRALAAYLADRDPGVALTDGAVIRLDENEHTKEEEHGRAGHL